MFIFGLIVLSILIPVTIVLGISIVHDFIDATTATTATTTYLTNSFSPTTIIKTNENHKHVHYAPIVAPAPEPGKKFHPAVFDAIYCTDCSQVDSMFNHKVWSHGLAAYRGGKEEINIIKKSKIDQEWEICCSDKTQLIGPIGYYVQGSVSCVFNLDVDSYVTEDGRNFPRFFVDELVFKLEDYNLTKYKNHSEIILKNTKIVGVWVKDETLLSLAEELAKNNNVKLYDKSKSSVKDDDLIA